MPQRPKNFEIAHVAIEPARPTHMVSTGAGVAAPQRFKAYVNLAVPNLRLMLAIIVTAGGQPIADYVTVWANGETPLTSGTLRKILLDPILKAAIAEASQPAEPRPDVAPGAFHVVGEPEDQLWVSTPAGATERVRQIARLYNEALTAGSRSPALDAAEAVHISRGQAARYIKKARELGLIPPVEEVTSVREAARRAEFTAAEEWPATVDPVANPPGPRHRGPDIFRDLSQREEDHAGDQDG